MNNEEFHVWAMDHWKAEVLRNLPGAKARRAGQISQRESNKSLAKAWRSLAAQQAAQKRKFNTRLAEIEQKSRDRREAQDREFEERWWDLLMGKK